MVLSLTVMFRGKGNSAGTAELLGSHLFAIPHGNSCAPFLELLKQNTTAKGMTPESSNRLKVFETRTARRLLIV
ncbi:hypothetical protein [Mesorhizobium sp. WSM4904]|uniref:hypothetical protein n=1 Tax=Mesorhizobium sp. WSM4904 TaxID=3038545 RepID=UPI0024186C14|nr:hypothetical protein [Mesorhizobium sp. WSM4904]WFP64531.1 hypothetical protein QAZ47_08445 [Mesorhizobium sp. WSM4904]